MTFARFNSFSLARIFPQLRVSETRDDSRNLTHSPQNLHQNTSLEWISKGKNVFPENPLEWWNNFPLQRAPFFFPCTVIKFSCTTTRLYFSERASNGCEALCKNSTSGWHDDDRHRWMEIDIITLRLQAAPTTNKNPSTDDFRCSKWWWCCRCVALKLLN